jgi:mRNA interferase MazF
MISKIQKDFNKWNERKKGIDRYTKNILPKKREIWWLSIGLNVGVEQDGKNNNFERPVLVVKVFNRQCFLGMPITSADKSNQKYYFPITYNNRKFFLVLSQIRLFSTKRLSRIIYKADNQEFLKIKEELKRVIGLN